MRRALPASRSYDVIVVGAGYTGLAAARRIAEERPDQQILVIEGSTIGEGSAGRNSGFVINLPHNTKLGNDADSRSNALKQVRLYSTGLSWLETVVRQNSIDCAWSPIGKFYAAATARGEQKLKASLDQYREWDIGFTEYSRDGLELEFGTPYYRYGFHSSGNVFVQPAALIRGLADSLPTNVTVIEQNPVLDLKGSTTLRVVTQRCEFSAGKVIIANNGFAKKLGLLQDRLITMFTYAAITRPLDDEERAKLGRLPEWGTVPANRIGSTLRKTGDGRFLIRSALSYEREMDGARVSELLTESYRRRYPNMASHSFEHVWSGVTALTRNGATFFGELRPNVYVSAGCNGVGILKGSMFGRLLADLSLGLDSEELHQALAMEKPTWLPPEPFRKIGVMSAIRYHAATAGPER